MKNLCSGVAGLALVVAMSVVASPAWAGFKVCNKAKEDINVAIGYNSKDYGWMSEGWWSVSPGDCTRLVHGDLDQRYYYIYAIGDDGGLWAAHKGEQDGGFFCISKHKFTYRNSDYMKKNVIDCESGNETTKQFVEVDTENADDFTYDLTN